MHHGTQDAGPTNCEQPRSFGHLPIAPVTTQYGIGVEQILTLNGLATAATKILSVKAQAINVLVREKPAPKALHFGTAMQRTTVPGLQPSSGCGAVNISAALWQSPKLFQPSKINRSI
jgi:ribulose kinase